MAGVYTPSSIAIQDHSLAIKIHERPPCNFVFTCLYALIRSGIRPIPEFEHFPQWKAAIFVTIHLPRKFSLPGEESWLSAYFSFFHFLHAPARVTTQFTRYLFTFFSLYAKFLVNRATFSHFSRRIFNNFDHDHPSARQVYHYYSHSPIAQRMYPRDEKFAKKFSIFQPTTNTTPKRDNRWLRFLRLVSRNSPFKGVFPNPSLDSLTRTPIPSNSTVT